MEQDDTIWNMQNAKYFFQELFLETPKSDFPVVGKYFCKGVNMFFSI
jgi:hypothetical protein